MRQEAGEQQFLSRKERQQHRNKLFSRIGLLLVLLSVCSLGLSIFLLSVQNASVTTKDVPTYIPSRIKPISSSPCFSVSPQMLIFSLSPEDPHGTQTVVLANCSLQATSWSIIVSASWLHVSLTRGDMSGGTVQNVTIVVSPSDLFPGKYVGQVTILASSGITVMVSVSLVVLGAPPLTPTPDVWKDKLISHTSIPHLTIVAVWPYLIKEQSVNITVSLIISGNALSGSPPSVTPENEPSIHRVAPVNASVALLKDIYGPEYELNSIVAQLDGTAFVISPSLPQSPDQKVINFRWNILPQVAGPQSLEVSIGGQWKPSNGGELVTSYFLQGGFTVNVSDSPPPFIALGQVTLGELVPGLLGSILNIPWIVDYMQKRRQKKEEKQMASSAGVPNASSKQPGKQRKKRRQSR